MSASSAHPLVGALVAAAVLVSTPAATAKDFGPGDLLVCNSKRCVPIMDRDVLPALSSFYYTGPQPPTARAPSMGAPAFELRFTNGYTTGIVASVRLDRFLSYGVYLGRFRRGTWYRMQPRAAAELRRLASGLEPLHVTPAAVARSR